jgi:hypothetical protein
MPKCGTPTTTAATVIRLVSAAGAKITKLYSIQSTLPQAINPLHYTTRYPSAPINQKHRTLDCPGSKVTPFYKPKQKESKNQQNHQIVLPPTNCSPTNSACP